VATWSTITVHYRGLSGRRELLCTWLPHVVDTIGTTDTTRDWFYADTITPNGPDAPADPREAEGEIEIAIAIGDLDAKVVDERIRTSLEPLTEQGTVTDIGVLPRPRLLDPVLFAGSSPSLVYTALLTEGTQRALEILRQHEQPRSAVTSEVEAFLNLVDLDERVLLAEHYASWLERVARRRAGDAAPATGDADAATTPSIASGSAAAPLDEPIAKAFVDEAASLPMAHRLELVARLAHIQAIRIDPTLTIAEEAALVRSLLPGFAHRATKRDSGQS